jgi:Zn-dependent protease with chaperone function
MAFNELKKDLIEAEVDIRSYLDNSEEYFKLKIFKALMRGITAITHIIVIAAIAFLALFILSLAVSYIIGSLMDFMYYGFIIVGLFYVVLAILCYLFRDKLDAPLLKKISKYYFDQT